MLEKDIDHIFQKGIIDGKNFIIVDFFIPCLKLVIEIDGGYHYTESQRRRDYYKDKHCKERGFDIIRIDNKDILNFDFDELKLSVDKKEPTEFLRALFI